MRLLTNIIVLSILLLSNNLYSYKCKTSNFYLLQINSWFVTGPKGLLLKARSNRKKALNLLETSNKATKLLAKAAKQYEQAADLYLKDNDKMNASISYSKAATVLLKKLMNIYKAIELFEKAIKAYPNGDKTPYYELSDIYLAKADFHYSNKELNKEAEALQKVIVYNQKMHTYAKLDLYSKRLAEIYIKLGEYYKAAKFYELAFFNQYKSNDNKVSRDEIISYYSLIAYNFAKAGNKELSKKYYKELLKAHLANKSYRTAASIYELIENYDSAIRYFLISKNIEDAGRCYIKAGEIGKAITLYRVNGKLKWLAELYVSRADYEKAIEIYKELGNKEELAAIYMKLGRYGKASELFLSKANFYKSYDAPEFAVQFYNKAIEALNLRKKQLPKEAKEIDKQIVEINKKMKEIL